MQQQNTEMDARYRTMMVLWFVMLMTQLMFVGVLMAIKPEAFSGEASTAEPAIVIAFAALAFVNLALSFVMRRRAVQQAVAERKPQHVMTGVVLGCALCESISILGFVLAFAFAYPYFYLWFVLGVVGIFLHFPRRKDLLDAAYGPGTA